MRILMLNNEYPPLGGGTGSVNQALLNQFSQVPDFKCDLVTSALGKQYKEELYSDRIRLLKVPVNNQNIHHSSNRELLKYAARALRLSLRLHRKNPYDLCWAWSAVPAGGVALALSYLTDLKYFVRVSGPDIPGFEQRYRYLYPVLSPIIRKIWHRAITIVAKCKGEAEMIYKVSKPVKIDLIPNGVDLDVFQPGDPIPNEGTLRLICVARLIKRKGQHHLIQVVQSLQQQGLDLELEFVGTGDEEGKYKDLAKQLGISDRVKFLGYVPRQDIPALYRKAHVFVLPSFNEGMSVSTLEAMASGLPVIVTNTGGTEELVHHGVNGYVFEWGDLEAFLTHLKNMAKDRQSARRMGMASRKRAEQFSWSRAANSYLVLFDRLLSGRIDSPTTGA